MLSAKATFSAVILAAGNSSRMERPKHLLKFDGSHNFLEIIASSFLDFGSAKVIVVLNEDNYNDMKKREMRDGVVCVLNSEPANGRFSSLQAGLRSLSNHGPVFVHNVDNPFVKRETLLRLTQMLGEYDYIKPMFNGLGGHPFLISSNVVGSILKEVNQIVHLKDFLNNFSSIGVEVTDKNILTNINSKEDYRNSITKK